MGVGEPATDGDCMLWMEDVGCGRIIDDDSLSQVTAHLGKVLELNQYCSPISSDNSIANLNVVALQKMSQHCSIYEHDRKGKSTYCMIVT